MKYNRVSITLYKPELKIHLGDSSFGLVFSSVHVHYRERKQTAYIHLRFATMNELSVGFVSLTLFEGPAACH